jgi:NADPH-dependent 2,4-dienoyl-CoA reductase/sulfur reductase-like enzyme
MPNIDRRRFLAGSAAAAATTAAATALPSPAGGLLGGKKTPTAQVAADPAYNGKRHVAVLGGGCGGLSVAHELLERGFTVDVYERYPVAGG